MAARPSRSRKPPAPPQPRSRSLDGLPYAPYLTPLHGEPEGQVTYDSVHLDRRDLDGVQAGGSRFIESAFSAVAFEQGSLRRGSFRDAWLSAVRFVGTDLAETEWLDAEVQAGSWAGVEAFGAQLRRVSFFGCKLDSVNFRVAELEDVVFVDCLLRDVDLGDASLTRVSVDGSTLDGVRLRGARLDRFDLRGARELRVADGVESLRGAVISTGQLIELAPDFADALGVTVEDRD